MRINLKDIPEEGKSFVITNKTGELNAVLQDLIGKRPYEVSLFIRPLNARDFEMTGTVKTGLPEQCSRCGLDFDHVVDSKLHEIMIPEQEHPRNGKYARVNHASEEKDEGTSVVHHQDFYFEASEYVHEIVALATPFNPAPAEDKMGNCSLCKISLKDRVFSYNEDIPEEVKKESPFSVLKGIKLN